MKFFRHYFVFVALLPVCVFATDLKSDSDLFIREGGNLRPVKAGEKVKISDRQASVLESPGHIPMLIVPISTAVPTIQVALKPWGSPAGLPADYWKNMDRLVGEIVSVQKLLKDRRGEEALSMAEGLSNRYPQMQQLRLLKASCYLLLGQKEAAAALMQSVPETTPEMPTPPPAVEPPPSVAKQPAPEQAPPVQPLKPAPAPGAYP